MFGLLDFSVANNVAMNNLILLICNFLVKIVEMASLDWKVNVFALLLDTVKFLSIRVVSFCISLVLYESAFLP